MSDIEFYEGKTPLLISVPHAGTLIPAEVRDCMQPEALFLPDTDWFVDKLYAWAQVEGAGLIKTPWSRYLVDLNRPPDDEPLYDRPGSSLAPMMTFCGNPIYREGREPDRSEIEERVKKYWQPYHELLSRELDNVRERHGHAVLLDAHSIRSVLPNLFEGELPHLNLGSNDGASADPSLADAAWESLSSDRFKAVRDGRFKGGYITRHYGRPDEGYHAVQLEVAQRSYMDEFPPHWDVSRARPLIEVLKRLVKVLEEWKPAQANRVG